MKTIKPICTGKFAGLDSWAPNGARVSVRTSDPDLLAVSAIASSTIYAGVSVVVLLESDFAELARTRNTEPLPARQSFTVQVLERLEALERWTGEPGNVEAFASSQGRIATIEHRLGGGSFLDKQSASSRLDDIERELGMRENGGVRAAESHIVKLDRRLDKHLERLDGCASFDKALVEAGKENEKRIARLEAAITSLAGEGCSTDLLSLDAAHTKLAASILLLEERVEEAKGEARSALARLARYEGSVTGKRKPPSRSRRRPSSAAAKTRGAAKPSAKSAKRKAARR